VSCAATSRAPNHENPLYWMSTSPARPNVTCGRLPSKLARIKILDPSAAQARAGAAPEPNRSRPCATSPIGARSRR
jgi:hypothetical protein